MNEEKPEKKPVKRIMLPGTAFLTGTGKYARDKKYATFNRRMIAATIDSILAMVLLAPVFDYFLSSYYPLPPIDSASIAIPAEATKDEVNAIIVKYLVDSGYAVRWFNNFTLQFAVLSVVSGMCWYFWQATPGKMIMRLKVVDATTEGRITIQQILMRLLGYVVSTFSLCIGFFWIGLDKRRQSWHDKMANTLVITVPFRKKKDPKPETEAAAQSDPQEPSTKE